MTPQEQKEQQQLRTKINWLKIMEPSSIGPLIVTILGGVLLVVSLWLKSGFAAGIGTMGLLLLAASRPYRDLLIAGALLGTTWWGFSRILTRVWEPGSIEPTKTAIVIAITVSWTILVAFCLGRLHGGRNDE